MEFSSNIILKEKSKRSQAIYASQLYGTFFGVFGLFDVARNMSDSSRMWIKKIHFTLINYKGYLNLEIQDNDCDNCLSVDSFKLDDSKMEGFQINMPVQHTKEAEPIQTNLIFDLTNITGTKRDPKKITEQGKGLLVEKDKFLRIERILVPLHPNKHASDLKKSSYQGVFDAEHYRRDGNFYDSLKPMKYDKKQTYNPDIGLWPSPSCVPSNNKIHFD